MKCHETWNDVLVVHMLDNRRDVSLDVG